MPPKLHLLILCALCVLGGAIHAAEAAVDFARDIEPIFQEHCLDCHGPDKAKAEFRVDRLSSLLRGGDTGEAAIVPGNASASFLVKAIRHEEPDYEMPPKGDPLSEAEIAKIERWITEGAKTPESYGAAEEKKELTHWSFKPLHRNGAGKSIDDFITAKLAENGLTPSPEADRRALIRRLFLVMHGLPPTPERVDAFIADQRPDAWQRLVEEVLASPHYGERWATQWLDLVRFGETHGFETNRERINAWPYRDWVIEALNSDQPYDQFVRGQIAGDALGADIGTGFLVAGPFDAVKGQDPKLRIMQRMNELDDMINTTGTAFLGLTTGCARCHNHKFDPITQEDYYAMQAIFAGVKHEDRELPLPTETQQKINTLDERIAGLKKKLHKFLPATTGAVIAMDDGDAQHLIERRGEATGLTGPQPDLSRGGYSYWGNQTGQDVLRYAPKVRGRYRIWLSWGAGFESHSTDARYLLETASGRREIARVNQQLPADGKGKADSMKRWSGLHDAGVFDLSPADSVVLHCGEAGGAITADVVLFQPVTDDKTGPQPTYRPPVNARENVETFPAREARFVRFTIEETSRSPACVDELEILSGKTNVALAHTGAALTSSGDFVHPKHRLDHLNDGKYGNGRSWIAKDAKDAWVQFELAGPTLIDRIVWSRDREGKFTDRLATRYRIEVARTPGEWELVASSNDRWPSDSTITGGDYQFAGFPAAEAKDGQRWLEDLNSAREEQAKLKKSMLVYAGKFEQPGPTHRLYRGEPDMKREEVSPGGIAVFAALNLSKDAPEQERRRALAEWIASKDNPLTARVMVNRLWQFHFGTGIVDTPSDLGLNGTPPSHPELLDSLAAAFMENGWSLKQMHRLILNSTTWKQDNKPRPDAMKIDAASRLLWRFPPRRIEAEGIRDSVLMASGVLDLDQRGGPGFSAFEIEAENVRHYHPKKSYGPDDWRRMIYMTKVRQEKDVVFGAFDCPDASQVVPKRSRSTTPLQALNLLNSTFLMQQAGLLAERLARASTDPREQVRLAWQLCFQRPPQQAEIEDALAFIQAEGPAQFCRALLNANEFVFIP